MSTNGGPGRQLGEAGKFPLAASRQRIVGLALATLALTALFLRAWTRVPERPWFPLLALLALGLGAVAIRMQARRLHTLRVLPEAGVLRADGIGQQREWPLEDITALSLVDLTVHAAAFADTGSSFVRTTTTRHRSELTIRTGDEALVVEAPFRHKRRQLKRFSDNLAALTGTGLETGDATRGRRTRPALMHLARPESLNPDTGSTRTGAMVGLVGWVVGVMVVLFAAPVAAMNPPYETPILSADDMESRLRDDLTELGADEQEPEAVDVGLATRDCTREEVWFWGGPHGVARLEHTTTRPVDTTTAENVLARVEEFGSLNTYNNERGRIGGFSVEVDSGSLEVSGGTACLRSDDREEVEPVLTDTVGRFVAWLTSPA